jgi:hypothetical protein
MRRIVSGFQAEWVGNERIELIRTTQPMHQYLYETSPDRKRLKRRESISPVDVSKGDPLLDAERFIDEAWKAAEEYLRLERPAYTLRLTVRADADRPSKHVDLDATDDTDAIKLGQAKIAEEKPTLYKLLQARVCRGEEVIWSRDF